MKTEEQIKQEARLSIVECGCTFDPWRRDKYNLGTRGFRTVVLGASTFRRLTLEQFNKEYSEYGSTWFASTLLEWLDGQWVNAYWTKLTQAFIGESGCTFESKANVLEGLAFYNYFDVILADNRELPPEEAIAQAPEKFERVIDAVKPEKVIVLSSLVRNRFAVAFKGQISGNTPLRTLEIRRCTVNGHAFEMLFLPHPMTSYWKNEVCWAAIDRLYGDRLKG